MKNKLGVIIEIYRIGIHTYDSPSFDCIFISDYNHFKFNQRIINHNNFGFYIFKKPLK